MPRPRTNQPFTEFGKAVLRVLDEKGLNTRSQREYTGIPHSTVNSWLAGVPPEPGNVIAWAKGLGLDVDEWLELAGHKPLGLPGSDWNPEWAYRSALARLAWGLPWSKAEVVRSYPLPAGLEAFTPKDVEQAVEKLKGYLASEEAEVAAAVFRNQDRLGRDPDRKWRPELDYDLVVRQLQLELPHWQARRVGAAPVPENLASFTPEDIGRYVAKLRAEATRPLPDDWSAAAELNRLIDHFRERTGIHDLDCGLIPDDLDSLSPDEVSDLFNRIVEKARSDGHQFYTPVLGRGSFPLPHGFYGRLDFTPMTNGDRQMVRQVRFRWSNLLTLSLAFRHGEDMQSESWRGPDGQHPDEWPQERVEAVEHLCLQTSRLEHEYNALIRVPSITSPDLPNTTAEADQIIADLEAELKMRRSERDRKSGDEVAASSGK